MKSSNNFLPLYILLLFLILTTLFTTLCSSSKSKTIFDSTRNKKDQQHYVKGNFKNKSNVQTTKEPVIATIYLNVDFTTFTIEIGKYDLINGLAACTYFPHLEINGFDILTIETNNQSKSLKDDILLAKAVGYLEGYLTKNRIYNYYLNAMNIFFWDEQLQKFNGIPENVVKFLKLNWDWMNRKVKENLNDLYWQQVYFTLLQLEGLKNGYNDAIVKSNTTTLQQLGMIEMLALSVQIDLEDIKNIANPPNFYNLKKHQIINYFNKNTHCSVLFKLLPDLSDIFYGHNTWISYSLMSKIMKTYHFKFSNQLTKSKSVTFSSFPATIASYEDFYEVSDTNLVVIETSNIIMNETLYKFIKPESLLSGFRVVLANRMATNGMEWMEIFQRYNSGTYNNMWMVLDKKKFIAKKPLQKGLLLIGESYPTPQGGQMMVKDVTEILSFGYFPSYNVPFHQELRNLFGYTQMIKNNPDLSHLMDYDTCSRATIFRRDQTKVSDIQSMKNLMRYNNYTKDPLSFGNPTFAIASREDLDKTSFMKIYNLCGGATDAKLSSIIYGNEGYLYVIAGPTYSENNGDIPVFNFGNCHAKQNTYYGLPYVWNFSWVNWKYKN
ncbi:hypothetical protein ABK040_013974 [Willaertia magna]